MSTLNPQKQPRPKRQSVRRSAGGGRAPVAPVARAPLPIFYALFGLLVVVGIVVLIARTRSGTPPPSDIPVAQAVHPLNAPVGQTPEGRWYKGRADAPVTVIEYSDFQCPACASVSRTLGTRIDQRYVETGKVRYIFHDFLLPQHANAPLAAEAARCAGDADKFWPMHDILFARQGEWQGDRDARRRMDTYAAELGLDGAAFGQCLASQTHESAIKAATQEGTRGGVNATPTFLVDGRQVGTAELFAAIDAALRAKGQ